MYRREKSHCNSPTGLLLAAPKGDAGSRASIRYHWKSPLQSIHGAGRAHMQSTSLGRATLAASYSWSSSAGAVLGSTAFHRLMPLLGAAPAAILRTTSFVSKPSCSRAAKEHRPHRRWRSLLRLTRQKPIKHPANLHHAMLTRQMKPCSKHCSKYNSPSNTIDRNVMRSRRHRHCSEPQKC